MARLDLRGKTAIITGAGSGIGRALAMGLAARGCHLALADIRAATLEPLAAELEQRLNARYVTQDALLAEADFIVLQMPYSAETHHLIGAQELAKMKPTAILINSTRGGDSTCGIESS